MLARVRAEERRAAAAGCASTSAWPRASARRTGCSRRATAGSRAAPTSSSASSRPTAGRAPPSSSTASRSSRAGASSTAASSIEEMDTDAVIARQPDRRAGRRARPHQRPGLAREPSAGRTSRSIRDAGIHVVSTMNVQHLESVADAVATITGAPVNERLPDEVLLGADEIELVDMSPHALRQRMKHGNVYPPERTRGRARQVLHRGEPDGAARAGAAARRAQRVEGQLEGTVAGQQLPLVTERVLVLVDGSPAVAAGRPTCGATSPARSTPALSPSSSTRPRRRAPAVRPAARPPGGARRRGRPRRRGGPGRGRRRRVRARAVAARARRPTS